MEVKGKCTLSAERREITMRATFYIVPGSRCSLWGQKIIQDLNLVQLVEEITCQSQSGAEEDAEIQKEYSDIFSRVGCIAGEHIIIIDPSIRPVVHKSRKVPFALRS